jgi:hypothetical protein
MDLPPIVCSISHGQVIYVKRGRLGKISEMTLLPLQGKSVSGTSTARPATQLQFNINANALEIRATQSPNCIV